MQQTNGHHSSVEMGSMGSKSETLPPGTFLLDGDDRPGEEGGDHDPQGKRQDESASLLGPGRRPEQEDEDDELEDFDSVQLPQVSWLRRAAAYVLKRPHIVGLAMLAGFLILPFISGIFAYKEKFLVCEDEEILSPQMILGTMTLREKIGQMVIADAQDVGRNAEAVGRHFLGGVIPRPGGKLPLGSWPADWLKMTSNLQAHALRTPKRIPLLLGADAIHGHGGAYGATIFPHPIGLGATHNSTLAQLVGLAVARELRATGVRWALGPSLSVCRDPRWGSCYESYGENEFLVRMMGSLLDGVAGQREGSAWASIEGNDTLVAATGLGFMGDGGTAGGVSGGATTEEDARFRQLFMRPFFDAVSRGVPLVQLAKGTVNGEPIHDNEYLFGILKSQLRYRGVVVSAYRGIEEIPGDRATQVRTAVNRGVDMVMVGPGGAAVRDFVRTLRGEVATGGVAMGRIDDAVRRIMRLKLEMGLFRSPCGTRQLSLGVVGSEEHREVARSAVRQSLVLLKNGGGAKPVLLPLPSEGVTTLVTGSHADNLGFQCGGHTLSLQGGGGRVTQGTTILDGIKATLGAKATLIHKANPPDNVEADYAIIVVGEKPYAGATGDQSNATKALHLEKSAKKLILRVCKKMPCLVVLVTGRPLYIENILPVVDALVVAWLPGTEGAGVTDVIFEGGHYDFVGTSPITWFKKVRELPMNYGDDKYKPLFPYGFGLTLNGTILNGAFASRDI